LNFREIKKNQIKYPDYKQLFAYNFTSGSSSSDASREGIFFVNIDSFISKIEFPLNAFFSVMIS